MDTNMLSGRNLRQDVGAFKVLEACGDVTIQHPVGGCITAWERPNGLLIERVRTPLGVIGIIYESRPNVTADAGGLCL